MNLKLENIIHDYQNIIKEDGEVSREELKEMIMLDEEIDSYYKLPAQIVHLINEIMKPHKSKYVHSDKEEREQRMGLYNKGMSDVEIAKIQNRAISTILKWRERNNLESLRGRQNRAKREERLKLYYKGYSAKEIAEITGDKKTAIDNYICRLKREGKLKSRPAGTVAAKK